MNIETGETISEQEYNDLPVEEKAKYINILRKAEMKKRKRIQDAKDERFAKQVKKRRDANKRSAKAKQALVHAKAVKRRAKKRAKNAKK